MPDRSDQEITDQVGLALDNPRVFPGMSYAEGVAAALDWVVGITDALPIDPEEIDQ